MLMFISMLKGIWFNILVDKALVVVEIVIFANSLMGTTIQDSSKRERSNENGRLWICYTYVILSSNSHSGILVISMHSTLLLSLLTNYISFLLFLIIDCFLSWINSSLIMILTVKEMWSEGLCKSSKIIWVLNSSKFVQINN